MLNCSTALICSQSDGVFPVCVFGVFSSVAIGPFLKTKQTPPTWELWWGIPFSELVLFHSASFLPPLSFPAGRPGMVTCCVRLHQSCCLLWHSGSEGDVTDERWWWHITIEASAGEIWAIFSSIIRRNMGWSSRALPCIPSLLSSPFSHSMFCYAAQVSLDQELFLLKKFWRHVKRSSVASVLVA